MAGLLSLLKNETTSQNITWPPNSSILPTTIPPIPHTLLGWFGYFVLLVVCGVVYWLCLLASHRAVRGDATLLPPIPPGAKEACAKCWPFSWPFNTRMPVRRTSDLSFDDEIDTANAPTTRDPEP